MRKITWNKPLVKNKAAESFALNHSNTKPTFFSGQSLFPVVEDAADPKDELLVLLKIAAEVEHSLMLQYLYTAYSISDPADAARITLLNIAKQEMGHFLAVQNLLLSIGGIEALHLHKDQFRPTSAINPLPFTLERLSKNLLAKFVAVEAPLEVPVEHRKAVEEIRQIADQQAGVHLNPVGGLYMKIFWLFQPDDQPVLDLLPLNPDKKQGRRPGWHVKASEFLPNAEIEKFEALENVWKNQSSFHANNLTLSRVQTSRQALELVYEISVQGEGTSIDDATESHFKLFLNRYLDFDQTISPVKKLPLNPVTVVNPEFKTSVLIENEYSRLWAELLNTVYTSLLLDIYSSFYYSQFSQLNKNAFIGIIFSCMKSTIRPLSEIIATLPLLNNGFTFDADPRCGPTYEIDPKFKLSTVKEELDELNRHFIEKIGELFDSIQNHVEYENHLTAEVNAGSIFNAEGALIQAKTYSTLKSQLFENLNQ